MMSINRNIWMYKHGYFGIVRGVYSSQYILINIQMHHGIRQASIKEFCNHLKINYVILFNMHLEPISGKILARRNHKEEEYDETKNVHEKIDINSWWANIKINITIWLRRATAERIDET